jgi:hypothetical protein
MEAGVDGFVLHVPDFLGTCGVARIVADSPADASVIKVM